MADTKISALPTAGVITGTEELPVVQGGVTSKVTVTSLVAPSLVSYQTKTTTINNQTGTTYTFVLADEASLVTFGSASATTVTVPTNASVAFPVGTQIDLIQAGTGKVTLTPAGGVTINSQSSYTSIAAQNVGVTLIKTATDTWYLVGSLIA